MSESRSEVAAFIKENKVDAIYTSKLAEMEQLLAKLQGGLHLEAHIDSLAAAQKAFDKIYKERLTELKGKTPSQNKTVRLKLQEIYDFLVDFTLSVLVLIPNKSIWSPSATAVKNASQSKRLPQHNQKKPSRLFCLIYAS